MIKSFSDPDTETLFLTGKSRRFPTDIWKSGLRRLRQLDAAVSLNDLKSVGACLESYGGTWWTIRVNDRYRVLFSWENANAWKVKIFDPH